MDDLVGEKESHSGGPRPKRSYHSLSSEDRKWELSPGSAVRPRRASPSSAPRLPQDSSHGRNAHDGSSSTAAEVARTQQALEAATATTLQRNLCLQWVQRDTAEAESAEKKAFAVAATAQGSSTWPLSGSCDGSYHDPPASDTLAGRQIAVGTTWRHCLFPKQCQGSVQDMTPVLTEKLTTSLGASVVVKASLLWRQSGRSRCTWRSSFR